MLKKILIGLAILIGVPLIIAVVFGLRFYNASKSMTPAETAKVNDSVFALKDKFVDAYFFKTKTGYFMVDAGMDAKNVEAEMKKLNVDPEKVKAIFLTHTDGDHIGGVGLFKNAAVYMHKDEEQMVNGQNGKFFFMRIKWAYQKYTLLNDNDTLSIDGIRIKIIHTPGHTPGSCCFLIGSQYLATGDNVAYKDKKFEHFIDFFNMDTKLQEESLKSLKELNTTKYILTGHHGIIIQ